ncbi:MAG: hypothetical protein IPM96_20550 [Ignavibacteria bacterium]|nr:hypothetical protein [Ignavibacteria bacterium]
MLSDINSLTYTELKSFETFIHSPYFNGYDTIKKLFHYLKKIYPNIPQKAGLEKIISTAVYGNEKVSSITIRKLVSDFDKLLDKFLIHERTERDKLENEVKLLNEFGKKLLWRSYERKITEMQSYSDSEFGIDENYYFNKLNYYSEFFIHSHTTSSKDTSKISLKKIEYLNLYFVYQTLVFNINYYSDRYTHKAVKRRPPGMIQNVYGFINEHIKYFSKSYPDIMTLYYKSLMTETGDVKYFDALQNYYRRNKTNLIPI